MSPSSHVSIMTSGGIGRLTLERPEKRNAVTAEMWHAIADDLDRAAGDPDLRALVITGEGGSFSAGADLASVKDTDGTPSATYRAVALRGMAAIAGFPRPTLAQIDGHCVGAGVNIALACDVRFSSPRSSFAIPTARHGLVYDDWSIARLVDLIGSGRASHLLFSGATIDGVRAEQIGLVDVCSDDLAIEADAYLRAVAAGDPATIAATRTRIRRAAGLVFGHAESKVRS